MYLFSLIASIGKRRVIGQSNFGRFQPYKDIRTCVEMSDAHVLNYKNSFYKISPLPTHMNSET